MSSSSASTGAAPPSGTGQGSSSTPAGRVLNIAASQGPWPRALDQGTWYRVPEPLTIRYRAAAGVAPITDVKRQEEVTRAIWDRLGDLIPVQRPGAYFYFVLGICFDHEIVWPDTFGIIDIVCSDTDSCQAIRRELQEIRIHDDFGGASVFTQYSWGGALSQDVLPFDIFDNYVTMAERSHWRLSKFMPTLHQIAAKLGELTGPIRTITTLGGRGGTHFQRIIRGYIKLSPRSLQLSYDGLIDQGAYSLDWIGLYRNRLLRKASQVLQRVDCSVP